MTVCIAAICRDNGSPRIIMCSDTRLSAGEWGSTDLTFKVRWAGKGWSAQIAGRPDSAMELAERIKDKFEATDLVSVPVAAQAIKSAMDDFKTLSPLCVAHCCELLVSGFVGELPVIAVIQPLPQDGELQLRLVSDYSAIGSGSTIATVILNCRDYSQHEPLYRALYFVYEAKRLSEKAEGVGPGTTLISMAKGGLYSFVSSEGKNHLESILESRGFNAGVPLSDDFPEDFYSAG